MKNKIKIILLLPLLLFSIIFQNSYVTAEASYNSKTAEIVMEKNTNRIIYSNNINEKMYMASTTKIITAILVIESMNMSDIITVGAKTTGIEGSSIYLETGEKLSVKDLLYGLMLRSGNDCAETLAVACCGSIEKFADKMNEFAINLGAKNSHFTNPHGLHDDNHYTTAYDLALISCYAMKNPIFKEIVSSKSVKIPFTTKDTTRYLVNKNKMLFNYENSTGIKTGYTKKAGRCLVSSCEKDGMELISVVLNCPPMFERSKNLLDGAYNEYSYHKIVESDYILDFINDANGESFAVTIESDIFIPLKKDEKDYIKIELEYDKNLNNIKSGQKIGKIKIYCKDNLLFSQNIYTI